VGLLLAVAFALEPSTTSSSRAAWRWGRDGVARDDGRGLSAAARGLVRFAAAGFFTALSVVPGVGSPPFGVVVRQMACVLA
jgi:hypothetical protein